MHISQQSLTVLKHVQFYLNYIYHAEFCLKDPNCIRKLFQLVSQQDDWLLDSYWNDFVRMHNRDIEKREHLPFKSAINVAKRKRQTELSSVAKYLHKDLDNAPKH